MWMDKCIYSVRANIQVGNTWVYNNDKTKKTKVARSQLRISKSYAFCRDIQQGISSLGKKLLRLHICFWEYTQKANLSSCNFT